jgi:hypothetical protein
MAVLEKLASKEINRAQLFKETEANSQLIPVLLEGISSSNATVRYSCSIVLIDLSDLYPDRVYPYMDSCVNLLDSKFRPILWGALAIIANLTPVDRERKFDALFDKYYGYLNSEYMVTVANVVANSAIIIPNKPYLADRIANELLKVQNLMLTPHLTEECTKVIAEKAIGTFNVLMKYTQNKQALIAFAQKHKDSSRASLRREAQNFLKRWQDKE